MGSSRNVVNMGGIRGPLVNPTDKRHGVTGYTYWGCRCEKCVLAVRERNRTSRERRRLALKPGDHGADAYRNTGCRCDTCKADHAEYNRGRWRSYKDRTRGTVKHPKLNLTELA